MKKNKIYSIIASMLFLIIACTEMNDIHDKYLRDGETIYIGKVDSAKVLAGNKRFLIRYWISDPKAKLLKIYWSMSMDSLIVPIPEHEPKDSLDILVGDIENPMPEGNYTFQIISTDDDLLRSIKYEINGNVYGSNFEATLNNRLYKQAELASDGSILTIDWRGITSSTEAGIELTYTNLEDKQVKLLIPTNQIGSQTILENVNVQNKFSYRTLFIPEPMAIDSFYTESNYLTITQTINVVLNKNVIASDTYNDNYPGSNAVDGGSFVNESRWVSTEGGEHWIEIDLGQEYTISAFQTWTGNGGGFTQATKNFSLQTQINGVWEDFVTVTDNTNSQYGGSFPEITTDKLRYYVPDYTGNLVRLYELEVYSIITY